MTREKMIELLIEDRVWELVYAGGYEGDHEGLRMMLTTGFAGFDNYTDKELKETLSKFDYSRIKELEERVKRYKNKIEAWVDKLNLDVKF